MPFGPTDMASWDGFLRHATAGACGESVPLRVGRSAATAGACFCPCCTCRSVGPGHPHRAGVRRARSFSTEGSRALGRLPGWAPVHDEAPAQDVMAYLLNVFVPLGVLVALGLRVVQRTTRRPWLRGTLVAVPGAHRRACCAYLPRISLRTWRDADAYVRALKQRFAGQGEVGRRSLRLGASGAHYYPALLKVGP